MDRVKDKVAIITGAARGLGKASALTLAKEGAPYGITVNALAPGIIGTEPVKRQIRDRVDDYTRSIPLGRIGDPEDVAGAALFLASDLSGFVTGDRVIVGGGCPLMPI